MTRRPFPAFGQAECLAFVAALLVLAAPPLASAQDAPPACGSSSSGPIPTTASSRPAGTAARWAKLGLQGQVRQRDQRRHRPPRDGRRDPRPPPHRRGQAVRRDPGDRDRGPRHPRRRAAADPGEPPADHPQDPRVAGRRRDRPPAQRLPPRPPLYRHPRPGRRLHGDRPQLLPGRAGPPQEPGVPLHRGRLQEAEPVRARRRRADRPGARPEGRLRRRPRVAVLRVEPLALRLSRPGAQGEGRPGWNGPASGPPAARRGLADRFRPKLVELLGPEQGKAVKYAEAFEVCEYGTQPAASRLLRIFPFFGH